MTPTLERVFGYRGDAMHLPVADLDAALPFYQQVFGFDLVLRGGTTAQLARDKVQIGLAVNGEDPSQDGCAFHVAGLDALRAEFQAKGLGEGLSEVREERRDDSTYRVFFVTAPDGLCYWFGERHGP